MSKAISSYRAAGDGLKALEPLAENMDVSEISTEDGSFRRNEGRFLLPGQNEVPWYFCCATCDAKFFNEISKCKCPRCGSELTSNERIQPPGKLLTIKEASKVLSISRSKLYQLVERKEVCHRRIGAAIRFSEQDITEILESSKREREEPVSRKQMPSRPRLKHIRL